MIEFFVGLPAFKLIQVVIMSGIKFILAPLISIGYGFNYFQTVIFTTVGGILGFLFFYYMSKWIIKQYNNYSPVVFSYFTGEKVETAKKKLNHVPQAKKVFTRRNKLIIKIRNKYGFFGIIILTPVLLSIPIGAFLAQKYYSKKHNMLVYMSISLVLWSFFISSVFFLF
ncbi:hypothetical protein H8E88_14455 [candidate division KSB1 bacterium]|nr:hypothetical protein [candidate division KSB1 bacterium]MBL7103196.1 hypothetical protein [Bacteroidales bacterium]